MTSAYLAKLNKNMMKTSSTWWRQHQAIALCLVAPNATSVNHKYPSSGAIFSAQGMKPDPNKVLALQDLPTPQNQKELQSFLGIN